MKLLIKNTLFLLMIVAVSSCEKTINFDAQQIKPKIVVNGYVVPHQGIYLKIEKSRSILFQDNYFEALSDAKVLLYENDVLLKQLEYKSVVDTFRKYLEYNVEKKILFENGNYSDHTIQIKPGATYKLEVSSEGFDEVWCETTVPKLVDISDFTVEYEKLKKSEYGPIYSINMSLKINDNADIENFYNLNVYVSNGIELGYLRVPNNSYGGYGSNPYGNPGEQPEFSQTDTIVETYSDYREQWFSSDPIFTGGDAMDVIDGYIYTNGLFTDELMNGKNYKFLFGKFNRYEIHKEVGEYIKINIVLDNMSKDLYLYYRSRDEHSYAKDDPFAEPVPVFSNIVGGLGIFGSQSTSFIQEFYGEFPVDGKTYIDWNTYNEIYNHYSGH